MPADPCGELVYFGWHPFRTRVDHGVVDTDGAVVHTTGVLDARCSEAGELARVVLPRRVP
jgi:hypothetical protein